MGEALYPIPEAALDDRLAWIGTSGSGKTYNAGGGVEQLLRSGARVVIVDPLGVWYGLRLLADGKTPSPFNVVIFGGLHGDLPLNEHAGALIGETAATMSESCIIDLSELGSKAADRRFMTAFLESIFRRATTEPFHLVVDESDLFAPQKPQRGDEVLLGLMEQIVRRGRVKGFIPWLISQRPAVLNKNVLSQTDALVAFKLTSSQDRDAIDAWIEGQADREQGRAIKGALPTMQTGQGVVWIPGRDILKTVQFPLKQTFDSSRTPKRGEKRQRRDLKPLNLERLKDRLSSIEEEAKANDPKALKAEVQRLQRELATAQKGDGSRAARLEAENVQLEGQRDDLAGEVEILRAERDHFKSGFEENRQRIRAALHALGVRNMDELEDEEWAKNLKQVVALPPRPPQPASACAIVKRREIEVPNVIANGITGPQQRLLNALAWWQAFGISQPKSEQVAFVAGYSASSSGYTNLKGALRSIGLIDYPSPGRMALTDEGESYAQAPTVEVSREAFHAAVRAKLAGPQLRLLDPLLEAFPQSLTNSELAAASGYSASSSGFTNLKGNLRGLGFIDYPASGCVRAEDWLFP